MSSISGGNHFGNLALKGSDQLREALHVQSSNPSLLKILWETDKKGGLKPAQAGRQDPKEGSDFFSVIDLLFCFWKELKKREREEFQSRIGRKGRKGEEKGRGDEVS